jgi:hypothetical protein
MVSLAFFALLGCGSSGTLHGKVTHGGAPMPAGTKLIFYHEKSDHSFPTEVGSDGTYSIEKVPTGTVKIAVQAVEGATYSGGAGAAQGANKKEKSAISFGPSPGQSGVIAPPGDLGGALSKGTGPAVTVHIDPKYKDPKTTTLSVEVTGGRQEHHIDVP